jgi:hypothetical protein
MARPKSVPESERQENASFYEPSGERHNVSYKTMPDLRQRLKAVAKRKHMTMNDCYLRAIEAYVALNEEAEWEVPEE